MATYQVLHAVESPVLRRPLCRSRTGIFNRKYPHCISSIRFSMMEQSSASSRRVGPNVARCCSPLAVDSQDDELIRDAVAWCAQHGLVRTPDLFLQYRIAVVDLGRPCV